MPAIFTDSSGPAAALAFQLAGLQIAWGNGDPAWDADPVPPPAEATALVAEIGRRRASVALFCTPDPGGELVVNDGRYTQSATPTNNLYVAASFDNADGVGEEIREAAVYIGTTIKNTVPVEQSYYAPNDIQSQGQMLLIDRFTKYDKTVDFRVEIAFVLTL